MNAEFIQLSNKVIKNVESDQYFSKIESAKAIKASITENEAQYEVSAGDIEIQIMKKDETYSDAILLTFCKEYDGSFYFIDMIISDVLGTFISDWY